jgi:hypothetical protein
MPAPSESLATLRPDLGGSMEEFDLAADRQGFVANRVLPVIEADKPSGTFGKIPIEELLKNPEVERTSRAGYGRGKWKFEDDSYATKEYGWEEPVDERDARFYADYFDAEMVSAEICQDRVLRAHEQRAAAAVFNASTFTPTAVGDEWDDYANAVPLDDVEARVQAFFGATGLWPNALIINRIVFRNLRNCEQVIDRIASQGAGNATKPSDITAQMLARVFDLDEIIVAGSAKNGAIEGATLDIDSIWSSEYAAVVRLARSNNIKEPCLGRTIHWGRDGSRIGGTMETYRDESVRSDIVRCRHEVHQKIFHTLMCQLLSNVTTTHDD